MTRLKDHLSEMSKSELHELEGEIEEEFVRRNAAPQVPATVRPGERLDTTTPAAAAPEWKYVCNDDCRSPRCPAALK
jgi:hypothetical protein